MNEKELDKFMKGFAKKDISEKLPSKHFVEKFLFNFEMLLENGSVHYQKSFTVTRGILWMNTHLIFKKIKREMHVSEVDLPYARTRGAFYDYSGLRDRVVKIHNRSVQCQGIQIEKVPQKLRDLIDSCIKDLTKYYALKPLRHVSTILSWTSRGEPSGSVNIEMDTHTETEKITLSYSITSYNNEKKDYKYNILLLKSKCNYGGIRYWFECPNFTCKRKCSVLYQNQNYFVCRKCSGLIYHNQTKSKKWRLWNSMNTVPYALQKKIKRKIYNEKFTKKYIRYLNLTNSDWAWSRYHQCMGNINRELIK